MPTCLCSSMPQRSVQLTYYTHFPRIVSLLTITITYIQAVTSICIQRVGLTTIQCIVCTGSRSWWPMLWVRWKWEIFCLDQAEPKSLAFWASELNLIPCRFPWYHHYSYAYLSMQFLTWEFSAALVLSLWFDSTWIELMTSRRGIRNYGPRHRSYSLLEKCYSYRTAITYALCFNLIILWRIQLF